MKTGLLVYKSNEENFFNIGDYIQSLAASQFFKDEIDVLINREFLDEYKGDCVRLILNGWFMHQPNHWPPSLDINPLFISFHLNSLAKKELLKEKSIEYFKNHEPIGCRDFKTVELLQSKGVNAYFSGCLTLTLGNTYKDFSKIKEGIFFVDPYYETSMNLFKILKTLLILIKNFRLISTIAFKARGSKSFRNLLSYAFFYSSYKEIFEDDVLVSAEYITQVISDNFHSEEDKFAYAKNLLKKYSIAKFVVTSRIHAALPCLAIETPVLYVDNVNQPEVSYCRLDGLRELFNVIYFKNGKMDCNFFSSKISKNTILSNKPDYKVLRDELNRICLKFVNGRSNENSLDS